MSATTSSAAFKDASLRNAAVSGVLDAHEYITCHLRFGDALKAIVVFDEKSNTYNQAHSGRILFTRKRSDLGAFQICSFGFTRTKLEHANGSPLTYEFALVRDLLSGITKVSKDPAALLKRISKISGSGAIEFASLEHLKAMTVKAPQHIKYLRDLKAASASDKVTLEKDFTDVHGYTMALPSTWNEPDTAKARVFDAESQRVMAVLLNVDADGKETKIVKDQRICSVEVFDIVRYALEARSFDEALKEAVQQRMAPETRDVEKWLKAKGETDANKWLTEFETERKKLEIGVRNQLCKELTNAPADMIRQVLAGATGETKKNLCVGWTDDMTYGAAMDCFHLAVLQQPRHRPLNAVHESYTIRSDLMVDFLAGWCLLSAVNPADSSTFLNETKNKTELDVYLRRVCSAVPLHQFFIDRSKNNKVEHLAPMIASIQGWCRGLREQDIFGMLIRQTSDHRCVMVPTGNPEVCYMYWRSKLNDKTCVIREVVELKKLPNKQTYSFQVSGDRSQRVVLLQDSVERAYAKLSQRITVGGFDPADGSNSSDAADSVPSELSLRVLAPLAISDMFSFHTRKWTPEDEKEMVGNDNSMTASNVAELSSEQFISLLALDGLNGKLPQHKLQVMQSTELQQAWKGFRTGQSEDFQTYLRSMGADL
jgi:hypothetical protein